MLIASILQTGNLRQTYNSASKDIEFRVNSTSWRLMTCSEFLFNKLILKLCQLMVRKFKAKEKHQTISLDINCAITRNMRLKSVQLITMFQFFFNWGPLHARLNNHYKAWSLKEK